MTLSDRDIVRELELGALQIKPAPEPSQIQPVSVDLRMGEDCLGFRPRKAPVSISDIPAGLTYTRGVSAVGMAVYPGEFILATTAEHVTLPDNVVGIVHGKSSLGRLGLMIHATAGLVDPGFSGQITLELSNVGPLQLLLRPGDLIAQLSLTYTYSPARRPYGSPGLNSHYQHQSGPTGPRSSHR